MDIRNIFKMERKDRKPTEVRATSSSGDYYYVSGSSTLTKNPVVETCINKVANTLATIPLSLYVHKKGGGRVQAAFSPLFSVIKNPSNDSTPFLFYSTLVRNVLEHGNAYIFISRNSRNEIINFSILNPTGVKLLRDSFGNKLFSVAGKNYTNKDILHIPYFNIDDKGIGVSPITSIKETIEVHNTIITFVENYFNNSVGKKLAIQPGESWKQKDLEEAYAKLIPIINKFVTGANNAGKPMVLPPDSKATLLDGTNNAESDLKSLIIFFERQIANAFNIPYSLVNEEFSKSNSTEEKQILFLSECIKPLGQHITESFNLLLDPADRASMYHAYNYRAIIETDTEKLINTLSKEIGNGLLNINDARQYLELDSIEDSAGDTYFVPANLMPLRADIIEAYMGAAKAKLIQSGIGDEKL